MYTLRMRDLSEELRFSPFFRPTTIEKLWELKLNVGGLTMSIHITDSL